VAQDRSLALHSVAVVVDLDAGQIPRSHMLLPYHPGSSLSIGIRALDRRMELVGDAVRSLRRTPLRPSETQTRDAP